MKYGGSYRLRKESGFVDSKPMPESPLWETLRGSRRLVSFDLELTERCNNNCRHCYINLPAADAQARSRELTSQQIEDIVDQAVDLGALWCLITGGEPLLREDFFDIYLYMKRKGLLVSVFTNATLITKEHIGFFKRYPPRDIEVTVYGLTKETYERITRVKGSYDAFIGGLNLLLESGVKVRFKAMALRSNVGELPLISEFCRKKTKDYFRFDPFLQLGFDGNPARNARIKSERLSPEEIVAIERMDPQRAGALERNCGKLINAGFSRSRCSHLFHCGAGNGSFTVSHDGYFRLCPSLRHPDCVYDLKKGRLKEAWENFVPRVRTMRSEKEEFLNNCSRCAIINLCMWCPALAYLEAGALDKKIEYFCAVAHARASMLNSCLA